MIERQSWGQFSTPERKSLVRHYPYFHLRLTRIFHDSNGVGSSDVLGRRLLIGLLALIQILIANVSGHALDNGNTVCHTRAKNADRNAQNNQTQSNQMSP
jgi:hypothetical protein